MNIEINDYFYYRVARFSIKYSNSVSKKLDDKFLESIFISSESLFASYIHNKNDLLLLNNGYYIRGYSRTSPKDFWVIACRGEFFKIENNCNIINRNIKKIVKVNFNYMIKLIKYLEKYLWNDLNVKLNSNIEINCDYISNIFSKKNKIILNVEIVEKIVNMCKSYITISEIKSNIDIYDIKTINKLIEFLIDNNFLISEIYSKVLFQKNNFEQIIKVLNNIVPNDDILKKLDDINTLIKNYNMVTLKEKSSVKHISEMKSKLNNIVKIKNPLDFCLINYEKFYLNENVKEDIADFIYFMINSVEYTHLDKEYYYDYIEKYGYISIPVLDFYKKNNIDKFKFNYSEQINFKVKEKLYNNLHTDKVDFSYLNISDERKDSSFISENIELSFNIFKDNNDNLVYQISNNIGSLFGRTLNSNYNINFNNRHEDTCDDSSVDVEFLFIPRDNIAKSIVNRDFDAKYFCSPDNVVIDNKVRIELSDIFILPKDEKLLFISKSLKKVVNPKFSNSISIDFFPELYKFIYYNNALNKRNIYFLVYFIEMNLKNLGAIPRIVYKNFIIYPKSIFVNFKGVTNRYCYICDKINDNNFGNSFFIFYDGKELLINLDLSDNITILKKIIKNLDRLIIRENLFVSHSSIITDSDLNQFYNEFIFNSNIIEKKIYIDYDKINFKDKNSFVNNFSFDKWISVKFYMNKDLEDVFLTKYLYKFFNLYNLKDSYNSIFFVRYLENGTFDHIRVRFKIKNNMDKIVNKINKISKVLIENNFIDNIVYDTYIQEVGRYSNIHIYRIVEDIFCIDSKIAIKLMYVKKKHGKKILDIICVKIFLDSISYFNYSYKYVLELFNLENSKITYDYFREIKNEIYNFNLYHNTYLDEEIYFLFEERNKLINKLMKKCESLDVYKKDDIFLDIFHMLNNKLFGPYINKEKQINKLIELTLRMFICRFDSKKNGIEK